LEAYGKYILVKPFERPQKTSSGLILAISEEAGKYFSGKGEVLSVGHLVEEIKVGDIVFFKKHHEHVMDDDPENILWTLTTESIIGVEEKND